MADGLDVADTMAQSELFAKKHHSVSLVPGIRVAGLPGGLLSLHSYKDAAEPAFGRKAKKKR